MEDKIRFWKRVRSLSIAAFLVPIVLGLGSTVVSMISAFREMGEGRSEPSDLAGDVSVSLWLTSLGVGIAFFAVPVWVIAAVRIGDLKNRQIAEMASQNGADNLAYDGSIHVIYTEQDIILSNKPYADWREIQSSFSDYKASFGPWDGYEVSDYIKDEHPSFVGGLSEVLRKLRSESLSEIALIED